MRETRNVGCRRHNEEIEMGVEYSLDEEGAATLGENTGAVFIHVAPPPPLRSVTWL